VLNPKVALLFLSLLPQFLDPGDPIVTKTLLLSALFLAMGIMWLLGYAALVSRLSGLFRSHRVRRRLEAISGTVLVALGLRIAIQDA
jgi:threonine/homoserine/homoserine lactone efflux protein